MKRPIIVALLIAAVILTYFICDKKDEKIEPGTALLSDAVSGDASRTRETGPSEEGEIGFESDESAGNAKNAGNEAVQAQENTATFRIQGESGINTYTSIANFTKISPSPEFTGYLVNFAANFSEINVSNQSTYRHVISMMLPSDVTPGTYTEKSTPFIIQYFGSENGVLYTLDYNHTFSLTVDEWGGPGGRARGTFSGELKSAEGTSVMQIRDGSFNVGIQ